MRLGGEDVATVGHPDRARTNNANVKWTKERQQLIYLRITGLISLLSRPSGRTACSECISPSVCLTEASAPDDRSLSIRRYHVPYWLEKEASSRAESERELLRRQVHAEHGTFEVVDSEVSGADTAKLVLGELK